MLLTDDYVILPTDTYMALIDLWHVDKWPDKYYKVIHRSDGWTEIVRRDQ